MSNIFNFQLGGARFYHFYRKNLKKGAIIQKGRNNSKKGAIKGAIKTLRPMLKPLVSLGSLSKKGAMLKI